MDVPEGQRDCLIPRGLVSVCTLKPNLATNQKVGSSTLSGRTTKSTTYRQGTENQPTRLPTTSRCLANRRWVSWGHGRYRDHGNRRLKAAARIGGQRAMLGSFHHGFDFTAVLLEQFQSGGFKAHDQDGLRVGGAHQAPAVGKQHAYAIHIHGPMAGAQDGDGLVDHGELELVGTIEA